ncbi:MAG: hypothetical protein Q7K57_11900 [Burkholderiaceae bacterium]|nr:hypothetical protein [Burkholderiaceae bacterium]
MKLIKPGKSFLDKLRVVFPAPLFGPATVLGILESLTEIGKTHEVRKRSAQGKAFIERRGILLNERDFLEIELCPNKTEYPYGMTLEWNPAHLNKRESALLVGTIKTMFGSQFSEIIRQALVYRVDTAIDFKARIQDIAFESRHKQTGSVWGKNYDGTGYVETIYLGSPASDSRDRMYGKTAELYWQLAQFPKHDTEIKRLLKKDAKGGPRLRIENTRTLSRNPVPLHRLKDIPPPFEGIHVYSYVDAEKWCVETVDRLTLELAKNIGLNSALKHLPPDDRAVLRKKLEDCMVEWWNPSLHHDAIGVGLQATGLFPEKAFKKSAQRGGLADVTYRHRLKMLKAKKKNKNSDDVEGEPNSHE